MPYDSTDREGDVVATVARTRILRPPAKLGAICQLNDAARQGELARAGGGEHWP